MPRDYKHAKRGRSGGLSGGAGFVVGLLAGLTVAAGIYIYDRGPGARITAPSAPMAKDERRDEDKPAPASQQAEAQYDFYEMLPKFEVVVPENEETQGRNNEPGSGPIEKPGAYVLQAGSFRSYADADRMRALLALQGVESKIQKVSVDKDIWHRVRIGPITNLQQLEATRSKLRSAQVDALVIRVGE